MPEQSLTEACDQRIELAGNLIDAEKYSEAVDQLKKIHGKNKAIIDKSPYLKMGLQFLLLFPCDLTHASSNE